MRKDNTIEAFFALVKAGLWEGQKPVPDSKFQVPSDVEWEKIYQLAQEQSVLGLVLAGLERSDVKPPKVLLLQWIGEVQMIEQRNKAMNQFIADLIVKMRNADIYTILVKGQGIAQCYEKPLWRSNGDIDLLLSNDNYRKAKEYLLPRALKIDEENPISLHQGLTISSWTIELHGTLRSRLWKRIDSVIDEVQREVFYGGCVRSWMNDKTHVFLPRADEDIVFVFTHILQHFFRGGVGLRQICDWCRLLWTYRESLNHEILEQRIREMGVMTEWKAFAALAVDYLGMPEGALPLFSSSNKWSLKGTRVLSLVLETGNFGNNRDYGYYQKYPFVIIKIISLWRHLWDNIRFFMIFPLDSIRILYMMIKMGIEDIVHNIK